MHEKQDLKEDDPSSKSPTPTTGIVFLGGLSFFFETAWNSQNPKLGAIEGLSPVRVSSNRAAAAAVCWQ